MAKSKSIGSRKDFCKVHKKSKIGKNVCKPNYSSTNVRALKRKRYLWWTANDERTCPKCADRHQTISYYKPKIPVHDNCRCMAYLI